MSDNPYFVPVSSSDDVYFGQDMTACLTDVVNNKADIDHTHSEYALEIHAHTEYASSSDLELLEDVVDTKADASHTHTEYATSSHTHSGYATSIELDTLAEEVSGKANASHAHSEYASVSHTHDDYAPSSHSHSEYAETNHNHDEDYASIDHTHDDYATTVALNEVSVIVSNKANASHAHDDIYYTETEVDTLLSGKSNSTHNHDSVYDSKGSAEEAANIVQANLDTVNNELAEHIDDADIHFTAAERTKLSGIATGANNYSHLNSGVTAGAYKSVTVNAQGHVTGGTNPTTLAGYGITDAESKGAANSALASAKEYTDGAIANEVAARDSAIATAKSSAISTAASDATTKADNALASAKTYADSAAVAVKNDLLNNAGSAYDTLKELGDLIDDNTDAIEALEAVAAGKANASHIHAIADVTGLQSALDGKAASSHGTHVTYSTTTPKANGTAAVGTATTVSRSDHVHPVQTTVSGNAGTATKLATTRTISLTGDVTGSASFDGSANASITATVADDSHNHVISNVDGLQSALDGKSATSHTHTAASLVAMADALFATSYNGGVEFSYGSGNTVDVLTEISNMSAGLHTIYSIAGTTGNPKTTESWRMLVHKTSVTIGWVLAFDAEGSIYSNYQSAAGTFKGWRCIYDVTPPILWMGEYWCTDTQTVTPSKALSACRNGWVLVWSDYDTENEKSTNGDCFTTVIPKWNPNHVKWSGQSFIAAVPTNLSTDGTISFAGKRLYVHDTKITGNTVNDVSPSNDVCLRAIYEY